MNPFKKSKKKEKKALKLEEELEKWLDKTLVKEGNKILNNSPTKEKIIVMYLIAKKNWQIAMGEIKKLEAELKIATMEKGYKP